MWTQCQKSAVTQRFEVNPGEGDGVQWEGFSTVGVAFDFTMLSTWLPELVIDFGEAEGGIFESKASAANLLATDIMAFVQLSEICWVDERTEDPVAQNVKDCKARLCVPNRTLIKMRFCDASRRRL